MKLQELTYQTRLRLLPILFIVIGIVVYWLAIGNTVQLSKQVKQLEQQVDQISDAPLRIQILRKRLAQLESEIGNYKTEISHEHIFEDLSEYCRSHRLKIREFPESHLTEQNGHKVHIYQVEIEGNFHSLLSFIHRLEQRTFLGKLAGVKFQLKTDRRSRTEYLSVRIFLQTVN
ncbi:hypothetical protein [Marinifilum fragile]|uniref:hypothetical protein n=1 Tax=Marinifilum fragile TaxID=570161 RepID=UPI002AAC139F|nr:hypothetical protein [Marinifilum fragile]